MNHLRNFRPGARPMISARNAAAAAVGLAFVVLAGSTPAAAWARQPLSAAPVSPAAIADFYRARGGAPLWFAPGAGNAAPQLLQQLATAQADNLNPKRYRVSALAKAIRAAESRDPVAVQRAEFMLSEAFVNYARDLRHDPNAGIIYVDPELRPTPLSPRTLLDQAAASGSLAAYVSKMGWMSPVYAQLRQALASRMYLNERHRQLLAVNLERARALPSGSQRYVVINPAAQRLYMYENGQVVDYMRVVAGRPDPIAQTPMMSAFIRYIALNPYWNSPPDITARRLAPKVVKGGRTYLNEKGYEVLSDWGDHPKVIDPMTIDWKAVVAGQVQVRMRQKPGPANSMGRMKFMFPNKQGIWLHDTPEKEVLEEAARLQSNGCVRLEDAPRFARWLYGRNLKAQGVRPEQKVPLASPVAVYITYLTAVPSGSSIVYFEDVYGLDSRPRKVASR
ncbi:MAG: L,D-transpeptidase family protein [Sphingomicrobium sp.]